MTLIHSPRANTLLALWLLLAGFVLPHHSIAASSWSTSLDVSHDWRHEQVGIWDCQGVSTMETGSEQPYYGRLKNDWASDQSSLILRFGEYRPSGQPFMEEQQWAYDEATGLHTRTLVTNNGSSGFLSSSGPHANQMRWQGSFVTPEGALRLSETITRISAEEYQWYGVMTPRYYRLTCHKISG